MKKLVKIFGVVLLNISLFIFSAFFEVHELDFEYLPEEPEPIETLQMSEQSIVCEKVSELDIPKREEKIISVAEGDSLWQLAKTYGVTVSAIKEANNLGNYDIWVGQELIIPSEYEDTLVPVDDFMATATAYCPCFNCCGKHEYDDAYGITASGYNVFLNEKNIIAADPEILPLGTIVELNLICETGEEEYLGRFYVEDTGGAITGNKIDVFFFSHQEAIDFGKCDVRVIVLSPEQ